MAENALLALGLSHVPFEDLGSLQPVLRERGFATKTVDAATAQLPPAKSGVFWNRWRDPWF